MRKYIFILLVILIGCVPSKKLSIYGKESINLYQLNNMLFVDITINDKASKLLIDTGASKSLLDISKAEEFKFKYVLYSANQYVGLGGFQDIHIPYQYKVKEFIINFLGADLSEIQQFFIKDNIYIVGILGSDFLEKNNAIIDYKRNILYFDK